MAKRLTDEEKKEWIARIVESGKKEKAFYMSGLLKRFPECPSSITDWIKNYTGVNAAVYLTEQGTIMTEDERLAFMQAVLDKLKSRYKDKDPSPDYDTLKADNPDIDFYFIHLLAEQAAEDYYAFLAKHGCMKAPEKPQPESEKSTKENNTFETNVEKPEKKTAAATDERSHKQGHPSSLPIKIIKGVEGQLLTKDSSFSVIINNPILLNILKTYKASGLDTVFLG